LQTAEAESVLACSLRDISEDCCTTTGNVSASRFLTSSIHFMACTKFVACLPSAISEERHTIFVTPGSLEIANVVRKRKSTPLPQLPDGPKTVGPESSHGDPARVFSVLFLGLLQSRLCRPIRRIH